MNFKKDMFSRIRKKISYYRRRLKRKNYVKLKTKKIIGNFIRNRKVIKIFSLVTAATILILLAKSIFLSKNYGQVVAIINDQKIYEMELQEKLREVINEQNPEQNLEKLPTLKDLPRQVIEVLVKEIYVDQAIDKQAQISNLAQSQKVQKKLSEYKNKLLRSEFLDSLVESEGSSDNVRDKYIALVAEVSGKKEYSISHILVASQDQAENIYQQLKSSPQPVQDFFNIARKYSLDKNSAEDGGKLGYIVETKLDSKMLEIIKALKKGSISKPFETRYGWDMVRLDDTRDATVLPFDSVKEEIRKKLRSEAVKNYYDKILNKAKIEILLKDDKSAKKK